LERLISFLTGYVEVLARGAHLEKLLNLLNNSGLNLWDVKRLGSEVIQVKIRVHGFFRIRDVARRTGSTVKICHKKGLPFIWRKIGRRKIFWLGACLFIIFLVYLSSLVFFIKITGFDDSQRKSLLANLAILGLKPGAPRREVLLRKNLIEREVMIHTPGAVWLGITVKGVVAEVKVVKRKSAPAPLQVCDIVAARDGVITKLVVVRGMPVVKEGDTVARGDLLISGVEWISDPETGDLIKHEVAGSGIVEAKVWYDLEAVEPRIIWRSETQRIFAREYRLRWGRRLWYLGSFGRKPSGNYYWVRWRRPIYQGRNPLKSVELIKDTWQAVKWRRVIRGRREIEMSAMAEINQKIKSLGSFGDSSFASALTTKTWTEEGNFVKLTLTCEKITDIAMLSFHGKGQR
jgi:Putative stage IV sporulation protein YqfD.